MKRYFNFIWLGLVTILMGLLFAFPEWVSRESVAGFLKMLGPMALAGYCVVSFLRALFLIPSTPFILAGAISFPQWPIAVLFISLAGIAFGGFMLHCFPSIGGYDRILETKYPDKIAFLKNKMQGRCAFWVVAAWSFFPLVPTDVICYVAGLAKMPLRQMLAALMLGESFLTTLYVFAGAGLGDWLRL
jgi:uncharacterized membrane protein YdjX (TVP38/TMEM64 family)